MKDQLKPELLNKLKPGIKPSDLKKIPDEGYESEELTSSSLQPSKKPSQEGILPSPIVQRESKQTKQLQSQPIRLSKETKQAIMEANQKIRELIKTNEDLQSKNTTLNQTISNLKEQGKITENTKPEETKSDTFTCAACSRTFDLDLIRLAKKSGKKICRNCTLIMLKRANQITGKHIVLKIKKKSESIQPTFTCQTCQQSQPGELHQVHITNYQEQGIIPQKLTSICSACLENKVVLANFYCPRTSEGKDTWDPKEAQFDCDCPQNERRVN